MLGLRIVEFNGLQIDSLGATSAGYYSYLAKPSGTKQKSSSIDDTTHTGQS